MKRSKVWALLGAVAFTFAVSGVALAAPVPKVEICHATNSQSNPYTSANADKTADAGGHDGHNGPIWFPGITVKWGDIIPIFEINGAPGTFYPGKNWDATGMAILANGCKIPPTVGPAVLSASKAVTEATAAPGDTLHYTLEVSNTGGTDATGQSVSDDITALLAHGTFGTCDNSCSHDATSVSWTGLTITSGGTIDLHFTVVLSLTGWSVGTTHLGNTVVVAGTNCAANAEFVDPGCSTDTTVTIGPVVTGQPATDAIGSTGSSGPTETAWLLVVGLGVLLASIVVLTPARAKSKR